MRFVVLLMLGLVACQGANLVRNGSFEVPGGWYPNGTPGTDNEATDSAVSSHYVNTNGSSAHGSYSMYFLTRNISDPFFGFGAGTYTYTYNARASTAKTIAVDLFPAWQVTETPTTAFSVTTSWKRFTNTVVLATNGMHIIRFYSQSGGPIWIDNVQVETGAVASAFSPISPIEVGMDTSDQANVLFVGDAKVLRFRFWNDGASTNMTCRYNLVNLWNTNLTSGDGAISTNALASGATIINLTLPSLWGWIRATCYITNLNNTRDETTLAVLPYASQTGRDPNGLLGIHPNWSYYILHDLRRVGFSRARIFSPTSDARWTNLFPTIIGGSNGEGTTNLYLGAWIPDFILSNFMSSDMIPWIVLTPHDHSWHPQSTNANPQVMIGDITNYFGKVAYRYRGGQLYSNMVYEIINEPQFPDSDGTDRTLKVSIPLGVTNYASIFDQTAAMFEKIDPAIQLIAFGGSSQADQGSTYWAQITKKTNAQFLAFHFYPHYTGEFDPNLVDDESQFSTHNVADWRAAFGPASVTNKSWNTETYVGDAGGYHSKPFSYPWWYDDISSHTSAPGAPPPALGWQDNMAWMQSMDVIQIPAVDRSVRTFCRSIGAGFSHVNIQHGQGITERQWGAPTPTVYEINTTFKPWTIALLTAAHAVKTPGLGRIYLTNQFVPDSFGNTNYYVEAYGHTNSLGNVASIWCPDNRMRQLGLTNSTFALYDTMWNLISTNSTNIYITRSVRYLVSGTLSYAQFSTTIGTALVTTNADTIAPGLTIDYSPIGSVPHSGGASNLFKSTAVDESVMTFANMAGGHSESNVNTFYRWTIDNGATFGPWGVTNHFLHSFQFAGWYRVGFQAKDIANNESPVIYTPYFGDPALSTPSVLNVSGTANIGTVTKVP